jgi:cytochrome P450
VGPDELSYINAQAWKDISGQGSGRPDMEKDRLSFGRPLKNMPSIFNADRVDHSRIRRTMAHAFSAVALRKQEPLIRDHVKLLIKCLKEHQGDVVDMVSWYNFTTFDLFGDLAFGETFGCLTNSLYHPWVGMLIKSMKAGYFIIQSQKYPLFEKMLLYFIPASLRRRRQEHLSLTQEKVEKRVAKQTDRPDFLSFILKHEDSTNSLSRPELEINASTLIVAGSDTTATLLSGCTFYLLRHPHVMEKVIDEIRQSFETEEDIDITGVNKLKYMLAVLDEALRMYPPAPGNFHRVVPEEGAVVCDRYVPGGVSNPFLSSQLCQDQMCIDDHLLSSQKYPFATMQHTAHRGTSIGQVHSSLSAFSANPALRTTRRKCFNHLAWDQGPVWGESQ